MSALEFRLEDWMASLGRGPDAGALATTLLHSLWEGAAVALALAAALCFLKSSRARYGAACLAMVIFLGGLVVTFTHLVPAAPNFTQLVPAAPG